MGRKKRHAGLLAIDPSWKGMAVAAFVPVHGIEFTECVDIRGDCRRFDMPQNTIRLVSKYFRDLFERYPQLRCCSRVIVENQFKTKMRNLVWITVSCVKTLLHGPDVTVEYVPILKLKQHFDLELQHNYRKNKKLAVEFVAANERSLLCGQYHEQNDNRADAILLLNYSQQENDLEMASWGECEHCGNELRALKCNRGTNEGKWFVNCPNGKKAEGDRKANKCNGVFSWLKQNEDGEWVMAPKENKWQAEKGPEPGKKRPPARQEEPPSKKSKHTLDDLYVAFQNLSDLIAEQNKRLDALECKVPQTPEIEFE